MKKYKILEKGINFTKKLVIQGNSYCVRIPKIWIDQMKLSEGDVISITIQKPKEGKIPTKFLNIYKKNFPELKKFSNNELSSCLFLASTEHTMKTDVKKEKSIEINKNFENKILKEKGGNFLEKYKIFKEKIIPDLERMKKVAEDLTKTELKEYMELSMKTIKEQQ